MGIRLQDQNKEFKISNHHDYLKLQSKVLSQHCMMSIHNNASLLLGRTKGSFILGEK